MTQAHAWHRKSLRHRAVSAALAVAIVVLLLFALLGIVGNPLEKGPKPQETLVFDLPAPAATKTEQAKSDTPEKATAPKRVPVPPTPAKPLPPVPTPPKPTDVITVTKDEFAALDIGKLKKASGGTGSKGSYGPGEGPGGRTLHPADWYREPNDGELAAYLPNGAPPNSWAMIACRTAPRYKVENCVGLGESTPGLAAALRRASWQFLVLPPRINGKPEIGAWVRIRFDFTERRGG